ncbi:MAG: PilW family protein, partial [Xanthomonadales bacterium]|nr:PilW family protein [Xanthomonadales bacterium]
LSTRQTSAGPEQSRAFTLIELLVAMAVGVVVLGALVTLLVETNQANRVSNGVARMQENARFALDLMAREIKASTLQHCSAFDNRYPESGVNTARALRVHFGGAMPHGLPDGGTVQPPPADVNDFLLSPRYFMQGHECTAGGCLPDFTEVGADSTNPPAMGVAAGLRPLGSDVLTVRYLAQEGVNVDDSTRGGSVEFDLSTRFSADPLAEIGYQAGDLLMISNCSVAEVFQPVVIGVEIHPNPVILSRYSEAEDARVTNFTRGFRTVSYFLQNRVDPDQPGRLIPVLMRQVNGVAEELVEGIERLDFRYVVEDNAGVEHVLTADQVNAGVSAGGGALVCQTSPEGLPGVEPGCLWRSISAVEIGMMATSVDNVLAVAAPNYTYAFANEVDVTPGTTMPNGLPSEFVLRREFRTTVSLRTYNY